MLTLAIARSISTVGHCIGTLCILTIMSTHHGVVLLQTHRIEQVNLPYGLTPTENGRAPTEIVVITVLVTPLITETVLSFWFVT